MLTTDTLIAHKYNYLLSPTCNLSNEEKMHASVSHINSRVVGCKKNLHRMQINAQPFWQHSHLDYIGCGIFNEFET